MLFVYVGEAGRGGRSGDLIWLAKLWKFSSVGPPKAPVRAAFDLVPSRCGVTITSCQSLRRMLVDIAVHKRVVIILFFIFISVIISILQIVF